MDKTNNKFSKAWFQVRLSTLKLRLKGANCDFWSTINKSDESQLVVNNAKISRSEIFVRKHSSISFGNNCQIKNSKIIVDRGGAFSTGDNCLIIDATLIIKDKSNVVFGDNCLVKTENKAQVVSLVVSSGSAYFGTNANIKGRIIVDHGNLSFGSNSFLNFGSEIRCENRIGIGDYVFISYFVDIFDTNTHSLDWTIRQKEVMDGYPNKTLRTIPPQTKPIIIGDHVWVGKYAAILKGCDIAAKCVIGTRSVVTKSFPEQTLICGNPAKAVSNIDTSS